ncbi:MULTISPECIES: AlbA family DNA-binding domain-containing protein [Clostridium]|uniref:AlbA family DNA-binding domain-containing protein n=1 Tax=Clostridium TaxID=1485 RepID=UPI0032EC3177
MNDFNKDSLKNFFKEPTIEEFDEFLKKNMGEANGIEFKGEWIDLERMCKIILAIGNSGGGCIVIGVTQENGFLISKGIQGETKDAVDFINVIKNYIPQRILNKIELKDFFYDNSVYGELMGKKFQVIFVNVSNSDLPIICNKDSGRFLKEGEIYVRRGTGTEKANYEELQEIINKSANAKCSEINNVTLKEQLEQLQQLYDCIPLSINKHSFSSFKQSQAMLSLLGKEENKALPDKSYEQFLVDLIKEKQEKIKKIVI